MRGLKIAAIFIFSLFISGAGSLPADFNHSLLPIGPSAYRFSIGKVSPDQIMETSTEKMVTIREMINRNRHARLFVIGESHDNFQCHAFQRDFIAALAEKHPKLVVGFEFFNRDHNEFLKQWRNGEISEEVLLKKTGWYRKKSFHYGLTRMVMDVIKKHQIGVIGLNVPREILRSVSRKGFGTLSAEEKKLFPGIHLTDPRHRYFIKGIFGEMATQMPPWFENVYTAQKCWDIVMAESMVKILSQRKYRDYRGVIIAGSNHVSYKLGIPFRYRKSDKKIKMVTIVPAIIPEKEKKEDDDEEPHPMMKRMGAMMKPVAVFSRGIADYVFAARQPLQPHFMDFGLTVKEKDKQVVVTKIAKKSMAEKNGIREGDRVVSISGIDNPTVEQIYTILGNLDWNQSVDIRVIKNIKIERERKKTDRKLMPKKMKMTR